MSYYIVERPGLLDFLERMNNCFRLLIFTTKSCGVFKYSKTDPNLDKFAKEVVEALEISHYFQKIYTKDDCRESEGTNKLFKDLRIIGVPLKNLILIDVKFVQK